MLRIVVDTNIWIRILLGGRITLPVLEAWRAGRFSVVVSQYLIDELAEVWQRPRLRKRIKSSEAEELLEQLLFRGEWVEPTTIPPRCRDPKDHPVLSTAIDGEVDAILTGDSDFRSDDVLRAEMLGFGIALWGVDTLFERLDKT